MTGCQMAHVTCLAAARQSLLAKRGRDVEQHGLSGAPPIRVLCSELRHGTFDRALRLLGMGLGNVTHASRPMSRTLLCAQVLEEALGARLRPHHRAAAGRRVNTGAYDSIRRPDPDRASARRVGAPGRRLRTVVRREPAATGICLKAPESADSWATDGHKWLNVPYDCGYAFVAGADAPRTAMTHAAAYLTQGDARDPLDWTPEWSRRARGFPTYAALRELGSDGVADLVERCCRCAHELVMQIGRLPGAEIVAAGHQSGPVAVLIRCPACRRRSRPPDR